MNPGEAMRVVVTSEGASTLVELTDERVAEMVGNPHIVYLLGKHGTVHWAITPTEGAVNTVAQDFMAALTDLHFVMTGTVVFTGLSYQQAMIVTAVKYGWTLPDDTP